MIRKDKLGGGSNGTIYPVYLQSDRSLKMAVKEVGGFFCSGGGGVEEWKPQPNAIIDQLTA